MKIDKQALEIFGQRIFAFSGSGGFGKTSVVQGVVKRFPKEVTVVPRLTTRAPREGEVHGHDYFFVSQEDFEQMMKGDRFVLLKGYEHYGIAHNPSAFSGKKKPKRLISVERHTGLYYGIAINPLLAVWNKPSKIIISAGADCIGLKQVIPTVTLIYIRSSLEEAEGRLRARGDDEATIRKKIEEARDKLRWEPSFFDYVVDNRDGHLDEAISEVVRIIDL